MEIKTIYLTLSIVISVFALSFYIKEIKPGKNEPHVYSWLVWTITQGTAMVGVWHGGGGLTVLSIGLGTVFVFTIFVYSLFRGTKNITRGDVAILALALLAILVWWQLHSPFWSIVMVSAIDAMGVLPTIRKSFHEPWSEAIGPWLGAILSTALGIMSLPEYNFLTTGYMVVIVIVNLGVVLVCTVRRASIPRSGLTA